MKIAILSPHMDDAVLDAADHIMRWKKARIVVEVISVFTSFGKLSPSDRVRRAVGMNDLSVRDFETLRRKEDVAAMRALGATYKHLGFIDAAFRGHPFASVFGGVIPKSDKMIITKLKKIVSRYHAYDKVLVPLGLGGHIDHAIVRKAGEEVFGTRALGYYLDYPYALHLKNWRPIYIATLLSRKGSLLQSTDKKWRTNSLYASQMPVLFSGTPTYWECIINV